MKTIQHVLAVLSVAAAAELSAGGMACVQQLNEVAYTGLDNPDGTLYVEVSSIELGCGCMNFRFSPVNTDTDKVLDILLHAKATNSMVRIDSLDGTCDAAYRVYLL